MRALHIALVCVMGGIQFQQAALSAPLEPEKLANLFGTVRVLGDRCKISGDPEVLKSAAALAGHKLVDFVPGGKYWPYTRKAMDQRFGMIAEQGLGSACNVMSAVVQSALPGY